MDTFSSLTASAPPARSWRRHADDFKARVIELARQPGTSVSAVALTNGLNANMLRRWVRESAGAPAEPTAAQRQPAAAASFVHLPLVTAAVQPPELANATAVAVEVQRGATTLRVRLENRIRPIALGQQNLLFAGSLRAGKRAAAVMSLVHSAKLNGHDPYAYLKDMLARLPAHPANRIEELLPHRWRPTNAPA